jgi:hypothetical protein
VLCSTTGRPATSGLSRKAQFASNQTQPRHPRRAGDVDRAFIEPTAGTLLLLGEGYRGLEFPPVSISDHRIPVRRIAGDRASLIDHEADRIALLDRQSEIRIDPLAVVARQFVLPDPLAVVQDRHAHAVAGEVSFANSARDGQRAVGGYEKTPHAGSAVAGMVPVLADSKPLLAALPERRLVPSLVPVLKRCVTGVLFACDAKHPLRGSQLAGKFRTGRLPGMRFDEHHRQYFAAGGSRRNGGRPEAGTFDSPRSGYEVGRLSARFRARQHLPGE